MVKACEGDQSQGLLLPPWEPLEVPLEVSIDDTTSLPLGVYESLMNAGAAARDRSQHVLVWGKSMQGLGSEASDGGEWHLLHKSLRMPRRGTKSASIVSAMPRHSGRRHGSTFLGRKQGSG